MPRSELNIRSARGSSLRETLRYLRAELRRRHSVGSSGIFSGGSAEGFESGYQIGLVYLGKSVRLEVRVVTDVRKEEPRFVVEEPDGALTSVELQNLAGDILLAAVDAARAGATSPMWVRRGYAYQGYPLHGCYQLPGCRVQPLLPPREHQDVRIPPAKLPQFVALDLRVDAIDELDANEVSLAEHTARAAYLATFLDVPLRTPSADYHLVDVGDGVWEWRQQWYPRGLGVVEEHDSACTDESSQGRWVEDWRFPWRSDLPDRDPRTLYLGRSALQLARRLQHDPETQAAFARCARLYHLSMMMPHGFATAGLAVRVAAVESLAASTPGCPESGARERFTHLWRTFGPEKGPPADQLYGKVRSGMFHTGEFAGIDGAHVSIDFVDDSSAWDDQRRAFGALRTCIINWVMAYLERTS